MTERKIKVIVNLKDGNTIEVEGQAAVTLWTQWTDMIKGLNEQRGITYKHDVAGVETETAIHAECICSIDKVNLAPVEVPDAECKDIECLKEV